MPVSRLFEGFLAGRILRRFYFWAAGFFRLTFVGKKCPEKSSREIPGKILQNFTTKIPDTSLQRGRAKKWKRPLVGLFSACCPAVVKVCRRKIHGEVEGQRPKKFSEVSTVFGRREKTPTPKTRSSIWTLLRTPGRLTARPLPVHFSTKMSVVRPFSVLSKDEIGP